MKKYAGLTSRWLLWAMLWLLWLSGTALAATNLSLDVNQSSYLNLVSLGLDREISRVAIANPEIADVTLISRTELLIVAKKAGMTSLYIWTDRDTKAYNVNVQNFDRGAAAAIESLIGDPGVTVEKIGENVLLRGSVENQRAKSRAEKIAGIYAAKVVNLLEMTQPSQIRIEARIVEISTDRAKKLGLQYGNASDIDNGIVTMGSSGIFGIGQSFGNKSGSDERVGYASINATLQALITDGAAQILSQPSLVTMSGEKANILIGGEIPVPVSNSDGQLSVEWREYGIKLAIEPEVNQQNRITTKVQAEVSTLDSSSAAAVNLTNGLSIPALRSRKAETVIHLSSGGTMAIGGLINSEEGKQVSKFPFLGDLPVLGRFFRSTSSTKERKEIIILITPTLVDETTPAAMSPAMRSLLDDSREPQPAAETNKAR
ncbi:MAG: pilus assembly protein N-terminal domain-containing protein [Sporomusaceae bacterium]|nr:pilus assembly protein N-terminal domain-containing protein [Sporomusaceae bacterium]